MDFLSLCEVISSHHFDLIYLPSQNALVAAGFAIGAACLLLSLFVLLVALCPLPVEFACDRVETEHDVRPSPLPLTHPSSLPLLTTISSSPRQTIHPLHCPSSLLLLTTLVRMLLSALFCILLSGIPPSVSASFGDFPLRCCLYALDYARRNISCVRMRDLQGCTTTFAARKRARRRRLCISTTCRRELNSSTSTPSQHGCSRVARGCL